MLFVLSFFVLLAEATSAVQVYKDGRWIVPKDFVVNSKFPEEGESFYDLLEDADGIVSEREDFYVSDRVLLRKGFHPTVRTEISVPESLEACDIVLIEKLNSNIYVDVYETDELYNNFGGDRVTLTQAHLDLERPSWNSDHFIVKVEPTKKGQRVFNLPIHFRYQAPRNIDGEDDKYNQIRVETPELFAVCDGGERIFRAAATGEFEIVENFPVGDLSISFQVSVITNIITVLASIVFIALALRK